MWVLEAITGNGMIGSSQNEGIPLQWFCRVSWSEVWLERQNAGLRAVVGAAITASSSQPELMPISTNG